MVTRLRSSFGPQYPSPTTAILVSFISGRAAGRQDGLGRLDQDLQLEQRAPRPGVLDVEGDHVVEAELAATAHLPQTGEAWLGPQALPRPVVVHRDLAGHRRAGSDQAHVAPQDVPQLGDLVEARAAQEAAHPR